MSASKPAAIAVAGLSLAACAGSPDGMGPGPKENTGTLLGAGTGALLGAAVAGPGNRVGGAGGGGAGGGGLGATTWAPRRDKQRAYAAQMDALERGPSGAPVSWKNPDPGRYGTIVPAGRLSGVRPQLPLLHPHHLYRRPAADRARHRLPQPGRHLSAVG